MLPFVEKEERKATEKEAKPKSAVVKIRSIGHVTHDTLKIVTQKPEGFSFEPGQASMVSINKNEWREKKRPFTMTNLPDNGHLEFIIKTYPAHKGVTNQLLELKAKDELILQDVFGKLTYSKEGVFIAGGAGVTPFISILRDLERKNKIGGNRLILANKRKSDIILEDELTDMLGMDSFINILSDEKRKGYHHGMVNGEFLNNVLSNFNKHFYLCGPPAMIETVERQLLNHKVPAGSITKEAPSF